MKSVELTVNGERRTLEVEPNMTLLEALRDELQLTGTKRGCDIGACGACTVIVDGKAVKSCTLLAVQADGSEVTTIEGLAQDGQLHPIQQAFWDNHGLQCGFCTPGMIMTALEILDKNPKATEQQVRHGLEGNICRCTGYENIVKSIVAVNPSVSAA